MKGDEIFMNYYDLLIAEARKGLHSLISFLETHNDLMWTTDESDNIISIDIETWDNDTYNSEFLMCCEFNKLGEFIGCV